MQNNTNTNNETTTTTKKTINVEDIDVLDDAQFDSWLEATYGTETAPESKAQNANGNQSQTETTEAKIKRLESEIETERQAVNERRKRNEPFDAKAWQAFEAKVAEVTDLKKRVKFESEVKERHRKEFLENSFATAEDFERLWQTKLRDAAMIEETDKDVKLR